MIDNSYRRIYRSGNPVSSTTKLFNRNYLLLWQGQFVSRLGSQVVLIGLIFWIKHATGSAALLGLIQMFAMLPAVLLGPVGGAIADRHSRRKIIIFGDVLRGVAVLSLSGLMFLAPGSTGTTLVWITIVLVFTSMITTFFEPAIAAAIPDLVPVDRVTSANSLGQLSFQVSIFIGQGIGGTLFRMLGAPVLFLINGVTYMFSAVSESFISIPQTLPEKTTHWRDQINAYKRDTLEGFLYVWKNRGLKNLVLISAILTFFSVPVVTLLPFYVEDTLQVAVDWYGFIIVAYGVGSLAGYVIAGTIRMSGRVRGKWMVLSIIVNSAGYGLLGLIRDPVAALALAFLGGSTSGFVTVNITSALQITTPSIIRGRVFGLLGTMAGSLAPIAMGLAGVIADLSGQNIPLIYLGCGFMMTVLSFAVLINGEVRNFLACDHGDEEHPEKAGKQAIPLD